jgi:5-methylcytosine-specific restriction endonuclease McrA
MPTQIMVTCQQCGAPYGVKPYRVATTKFCSLRCGGKQSSIIRPGPPARPFQPGNRLRAGLKPSTGFTSERVRGAASPSWKGGGETRTCLACDRPFTRARWKLRQTGSTGQFCSISCRGAYRRDHRSGPNAPDLVGGPKTYRGRNWQVIRLRVVMEQCGHCAHCGRYVGRSLPVNHIHPFRLFASADEANHRDNLIGLCQPCHMRAEPRHGDTALASRR